MTRRQLLAASASLLAVPADAPRPLLLLNEAEAKHIRAFAKADRAGRIDGYATSALAAGPWSVTFNRPTELKIGAAPNDYVSEAPYWFPDPNNPNGPYIRRDGEHNAARFTGNSNDLRNMAAAVLSLGMELFSSASRGVRITRPGFCRSGPWIPKLA